MKKEEVWKVDFNSFIDNIMELLGNRGETESLLHEIDIEGDPERCVRLEYFTKDGGVLTVEQHSTGAGEDDMLRIIVERLNILDPSVDYVEEGIVFKWENIKKLQQEREDLAK